jgi:hypothetical protein
MECRMKTTKRARINKPIWDTRDDDTVGKLTGCYYNHILYHLFKG